MTEQRRPPPRGIPRLLMDPERRYLVAHTGKRWEVVAIEDETGNPVPWGPEDVARKRSEDDSAGDGGPRS